MPISSFKTRKFFGLFFLCATITVGCKKENTAVTYSITYTGGQYVGETVYFTTNEPAGSNFVWYFGDSTTSTDTDPGHTYTAAGAYPAFLVINNTDTLRKAVGIGVDSILMQMVAGTYVWHRSYYRYLCTGYNDTISYSDTGMLVRLINPATISIGTDTLTLCSSTSNSIVFNHIFYMVANHPDGYANYFYLYPVSNSLNYQTTFNSACTEEIESYTTPL